MRTGKGRMKSKDSRRGEMKNEGSRGTRHDENRRGNGGAESTTPKVGRVTASPFASTFHLPTSFSKRRLSPSSFISFFGFFLGIFVFVSRSFFSRYLFYPSLPSSHCVRFVSTPILSFRSLASPRLRFLARFRERFCERETWRTQRASNETFRDFGGMRTENAAIRRNFKLNYTSRH